MKTEYFKKPKTRKTNTGIEKTMKPLKKAIFLLSIAIILTIQITLAQTTTENSITITSDKDTYFCEPILSQYGCLINSQITIKNLNNQDLLFEFEPFYTTNIKTNKIEITQETTKEKTDPNKTKTTENKLAKIKYSKNDERTHNLRFWTKQDGKFNITIRAYDPLLPNILLFTATLDPTYNVTHNSSTPSYFLINGTNMMSADTEYALTIDITAGLSDNNSLTAYRTLVSQPYVENAQYIIDGYSFNEYEFDNTLRSFTGNNDGSIIGVIETKTVGDFYAGRFDAIDDRVTINSTNFQIGTTNFTYCLNINTTTNLAGVDRYVVHLGEFDGGDGYGLKQEDNEKMTCNWDGTLGQASETSTSDINDGIFHTICCRKQGDTYSIFFDGVSQDTDTISLGAINRTDRNLDIAFDGTNRWQGDIEQLGFARQSISQPLLTYMNATKQLTNLTLGMAISVTFNHTIDTSQSYFLLLRNNISTTTTYRVIAYHNETHINASKSVTRKLTGQDEYFPLDTIITNNTTPRFRIFNLIGTQEGSIEEIYLYQTINDTTPPVIHDYSVSNTNLTCNDTITTYVNTTDDQAIQSVYITHTHASGTEETHLMIHNQTSNLYYYTAQLSGIFNETRNITLLYINVTDLGGNIAVLQPNLTANYTCIAACVENWVEDAPSCTIFDNYTKTYTDQNFCNTTTSLPADNGTTATCNYCTEDIIQTISECQINETQNITYTDNNFLTCCALTAITNDCSILYSPYNTTQTQTCAFYTQEFNCTIDPTPVINKKINLACTLPTNTTSESQCVVNVYQKQNSTFALLSTNPEYKDTTNSILSAFKEKETRTSFTTTNRLLNAYYTDKELRPYAQYKIEVLCNDNTTQLQYEQLINPGYHTPDFAVNRLVWLGENPFFAITAAIFIILLLTIIIIYIKKIRG